MAATCVEQLEFQANTQKEAMQIAEDQRVYWEEFLPEEQRRPVESIRTWFCRQLGKFLVFILLGPIVYVAD